MHLANLLSEGLKQSNNTACGQPLTPSSLLPSWHKLSVWLPAMGKVNLPRLKIVRLAKEYLNCEPKEKA